MNNKVCVELIVPAIEERYNVFIPINKKTLEIIYLLSKAINEMSNGFFEISNNQENSKYLLKHSRSIWMFYL